MPHRKKGMPRRMATAAKTQGKEDRESAQKRAMAAKTFFSLPFHSHSGDWHVNC
jgi:hypothetical protein